MLDKHKFGTNVLHEVDLFEEKTHATIYIIARSYHKFTSKKR
ncbi:Uncharacterised protein [Sphingobacterium multivorum]|jgi:hypothetical protein|uniref:Uncharacterized protein n=1 Tax=Sphingobacterium multivorum TaxID=28454 RepID=A0A654D8N6_SPHMU|nr:Uncharacterised protein [Sphingobacterium multivorum]VXD01282.1 conserved hypothetical protein [Sphingobacterium multivorum]